MISVSRIKALPIFDFIARYVDEEEMYKTFNMGVGMILVVAPEDLEKVTSQSDGYPIGELVAGEGGVQLR